MRELIRLILMVSFLQVLMGQALAQDTITIFDNPYGKYELPGKRHFSEEGDRFYTLATPYIQSTSLFEVFQYCDTLIMVSDKWNLFRNARNKMRAMDVMEVYSDSTYFVRPLVIPLHGICTNGTDRFIYLQSERFIWQLSYATLVSEGAWYGPLKVGEPFSELLEKLGWPASCAALGCSTVMIFHPTKVQDVKVEQFFWGYLEAETYTALRLSLDEAGRITRIELGYVREALWEPGNSPFISFEDIVGVPLLERLQATPPSQ